MTQSILQIKNLTYQVPYGKVIFKDLSVQIESGKLIGLLGVNGSGKTTLIDLIMGIRPKTSGELLVLGEEPMADHRMNISQIAFLSQDISHNAKLSIQEQLDHLAHFYPSYSKDKERELLSLFNLNPIAKIGSLSTGQRKRVQIIFGFAAIPKLMLVDEITAVLDPEARGIFFQLAKAYCQQGGCILLATNIIDGLAGVADQIIFIGNGGFEIHGPEDINKLFKKGKAV
ncbi:MAG: hypothetical protein CO099_07525 [Bdellovibrio sp. CG_4_9_14_3_um_filter_39_7]|nr:MAG: hypothetical protein CO099_07525 [Bdellovibrio sp. CG_4_9_14_3_um_filter_39_7]